MKSFRASHDRDQSHYYRNYSRSGRGFLIISWGVGLYNRDKQIKIEEAIDIYVIRLKINRCFVTFVPLWWLNPGNLIHTIWVMPNKTTRCRNICDINR